MSEHENNRTNIIFTHNMIWNFVIKNNKLYIIKYV